MDRIVRLQDTLPIRTAKDIEGVMQRMYSQFEIKEIDEEKREIEGIATTPTPDRVGDIVETDGAEFKLPLSFIKHHDSWQPLGEVFKAAVTKDGIAVRARIRKVTEEGLLKNRLDEAWQEIKYKLIKGLSIGFKPLEWSYLDDGSYGVRFIKWLWLELSAVTIPANQEATITAIKSYDSRLRAASGNAPRIVTLSATPAPASRKATRIVEIRK